jgi:hypothetical protein
MTVPLVFLMLRGDMRNYIIKKVKAPFLKAIVQLAKRYPEPTTENLMHPNSLILLGLRDKFFNYDTCISRKTLFESAFRVLIDEYEHDPHYRYRIDWLIEEIANSGWQARPDGRPAAYWNESPKT